MICGLEGRFQSRICSTSSDIIGLAPGVHEFAALTLVITSKGAYFLADTHVQPDPTAEEIAEMTIACAEPRARASASSPRSRCCRTRTSAPPTRRSALQDARGAAR